MRWEAFGPDRTPQRVCHFIWPMRGHKCGISCQNIPNFVLGGLSRLAEEPGDKKRCIDDYQCRPSSTQDLTSACDTVMPRFRAMARSSSIALRRLAITSGDGATSAGTSFATGLPWRVIVTSPPFSTSSSRLDKCVLASKIPTCFMKIDQFDFVICWA